MSKEYIEKEVLLAQIRESRVNNPHLDSRDRHAHDTEHRHFEYMVFSAKPADVAPVMKGEWVHRKVWHPLPWDCPPDYGEEYDSESHSRLEDEWHCSNCDYEADVIHKELWSFCPNCGADMRMEANDGEI